MMPAPDRLTKREIDEWLRDSTPEIRALALALRALLHDTLPGIAETRARGDNGIGFGAKQYGADGWGIAAISVFRDWIDLGFLRGTELPDPTNLLEGTGKRLRHIKLHSVAELEKERAALRRLVIAARDTAAKPRV